MDRLAASAIQANGQGGHAVDVKDAHGPLLNVGEGIGLAWLQVGRRLGDEGAALVEPELELVRRRVDGDELVKSRVAVEIKAQAESTVPLIAEFAGKQEALIAGEGIDVSAALLAAFHKHTGLFNGQGRRLLKPSTTASTGASTRSPLSFWTIFCTARLPAHLVTPTVEDMTSDRRAQPTM